eukprot:Skav221117  [mRNA]  locus=scaffold233:272882:282944:- [translate_table: standard]
MEVRAGWKFNQSNGLNLIARAHQLVMEGFNWAHEQRLGMDERLGSHFVQFDPAPRRGEAAIGRPPVEYFL